MAEDAKNEPKYRIHLVNGTPPIDALYVGYVPPQELAFTSMNGQAGSLHRVDVSKIELLIPEEEKGSNFRGEGELAGI